MRRIPLEYFDPPAGDQHTPPHKPGMLMRWATDLPIDRARKFFDAIIRDDLSLHAAMPALFEPRQRVARVVLLMLERAARKHGLTPGELALIIEDPEREALEALALLADRCGNPERA